MSCLCSRGLPKEEPEDKPVDPKGKPEEPEEDEVKALKKMPPGPRTRTILASGALRLLSAVWLVTQGDAYVIQRMQDLPDEAFVPPERAAELFDIFGGIIVISYGWLSKNHPDPTGFHLRTVQKYLKKHRMAPEYAEWRDLKDYGVFWDFASLPQDHPDGSKKTEAEKVVFDKGLGAINLLYGDYKTMVIQLTRMPQDLQLSDGTEANLTEYDIRGWCFFEATVSGILKPSALLLDLGTGAATLDNEGSDWYTVGKASTAKRQPPLTADDMAVELPTRRFTNGSDTELVTKKYREFFSEAAGSAEKLHLANYSAGDGWGDAEVTQLARALPSFQHCKVLWIDGHRALGEPGLAELRAALPRCPALRYLQLPGHLKETAEGQALLRAARGSWAPWRWVTVRWL